MLPCRVRCRRDEGRNEDGACCRAGCGAGEMRGQFKPIEGQSDGCAEGARNADTRGISTRSTASSLACEGDRRNADAAEGQGELVREGGLARRRRPRDADHLPRKAARAVMSDTAMLLGCRGC
jgi:hypothetical protein